MKFECEYILKVKVDVYIHPEHSSTELQEKIKEEGQKKLRYYLSGYLSDPDNKIITDEIKFELKNK